jgi:hypothetical protein
MYIVQLCVDGVALQAAFLEVFSRPTNKFIGWPRRILHRMGQQNFKENCNRLAGLEVSHSTFSTFELYALAIQLNINPDMGLPVGSIYQTMEDGRSFHGDW